MNVAFDNWIPVVMPGGQRQLASLCEVLTRGERFADLAVRPHERVALMRLLLCVAHAALDGPKDYDEWCDVPSRLPAATRQYLERWKDSFELFHPEKPWLQVATLAPIPSGNKKTSILDDEEWTSVNRLSLTRASGNNTTLFDHAAAGEMQDWQPHELALDLLVFQNYFVAGGKASSRMWGKYEMKNPPNPKGGPCAGKSVVYTFLRGRDLAESVQLNLNSYETLALLYGSSPEWLGKPIWEWPVESPDSHNAIENATGTHLGRLVPQTRILRLRKDGRKVLLGGGFTYPKFQDEKNPFHPDAQATVVLTSDGERELLRARPGRSIWRELHCLTVRRRGSSTANRGPLCLENIPDQASCDIVVCAMITNPKQAAEIVDLVDSVFHIPARLSSPEGAAAYKAEVKSAEQVAGRLSWAVEGYRAAIDGGWEGRLKSAGQSKGELKAKLHSTAAIHYWTAVEKNLSLLMAHVAALGTDDAGPTRDAWRKMLFATACDSYRAACGQETPRQIRAFAEGCKRLTNRNKATASVEKEDDA
ncbi:type I-E CRISPR-associated protein Cse1/CasA [Planctomycetota bacterium]